MRAFLDTSILFPSLVEAHPNHKRAYAQLSRLRKEYELVVLNTHLAAELYSNLTRYPPAKTPPKIAAAIIRKLSSDFLVVELTTDDYQAAVDRCADKGLISGVIYDALHLQAAIKAGSPVLITANLSDFERLVDDETPVLIKGLDD